MPQDSSLRITLSFQQSTLWRTCLIFSLYLDSTFWRERSLSSPDMLRLCSLFCDMFYSSSYWGCSYLPLSTWMLATRTSSADTSFFESAYDWLPLTSAERCCEFRLFSLPLLWSKYELGGSLYSYMISYYIPPYFCTFSGIASRTGDNDPFSGDCSESMR